MERAGFMTCTAANHQGAIKEPTASLFRRCETHPVMTCKNPAIAVAKAISTVAKLNKKREDSKHMIATIWFMCVFQVISR